MGMSWAYNPEERDDERSIAVIRRALDIGVTLIDTADVYGPYTNEQLVGRALEGRRSDAVLATGCGLRVRSVEPLEMGRNGRPEHVRAAIRRVAAAPGHRPRRPVPGVPGWCREHGAAFIPFAPLGRGFLTGQVTRETITAGDLRNYNPRFTPEATEQKLALVDQVRAVADRNDATPAQVALAWLLAQYDRMIPIPGTRRIERLTDNAGAARLELSAEDLVELDALPAPAGVRYRA